jgi:hypothetical protein
VDDRVFIVGGGIAGVALAQAPYRRGVTPLVLDRLSGPGDVARRLATGLASVACLLDPELVIVSEPDGQAGGEALCALVSEELAVLTVSAPRVVLSPVADHAIRAGALRTALGAARDRLFHGTAALEPAS